MICLRGAARRAIVGRSSLITSERVLFGQSAIVRSVVTSKDLAEIKAEEEDDKARSSLEDEKSSVQTYMERTRALEPGMAWGSTIPYPEPELPDDPSEVAALDPAHLNQDPLRLDTGTARVVHIRQEQAKVSQAPTGLEQNWMISFNDEGELSQNWDNSLMGWVSGSDTMGSNMKLQLTFRNAGEAAYFCKKRGWKYVVDEPIYRRGRSDDAQYQDNFLPQSVAGKARMERKKCDHWHRPAAGTSHYFRPLKFHGDGTVRQHGPNEQKDTDPHVPAYFKTR
uniref:NADH dehydrogenase [ubiquinone] iron-sulfur protein 4, mitochondrial n=1 Tax=Eucampia antarctica TaxID=49252 RepID=A0A7S2S6L8_9STRA|mmetsp:Transcript_3765/g.3539  ORF Transcript_3765/g.3539 Transcript_3765/m.3539 type:complete len:281 (+) Transcript_3765:91-933(+)|eukprot:CAMPEP_0197837968 /NCGR_PEP_ID=MMETSP1437-20131217/33947_1 /TAXON_ID=49252 ORGANISM="Eucampia antarctica, Strain CCMP1452" /NCGR_SAMPLE_ID=MMETSP1437 /ASSEMBLY_ACC=CAM_ASM_001096 /LENGTH=280 /DNA_ID=CAMNT_0043445461 /DNA_START=63 /DNA_END=905 /DNA_ORIENTATION=+